MFHTHASAAMHWPAQCLGSAVDDATVRSPSVPSGYAPKMFGLVVDVGLSHGLVPRRIPGPSRAYKLRYPADTPHLC